MLFGAADTFRAAAVDQLEIWAERLDLPVISGQIGRRLRLRWHTTPSKPAMARKIDIVLIDTAGRLHTRFNLMEELKKVHRVVGKALPGAPHHVWLVMDATTGQNALQQARAFKEAVKVTGVILAKLDSSARGGMAFAIQRELGLPILFAGLGEKPDDLQPFDPDAFVDGILAEFTEIVHRRRIEELLELKHARLDRTIASCARKNPAPPGASLTSLTKEAQIQELQKQSEAPELWNDPERARV